MALSHETFAQVEYEALRAEERDRMNSRTQVWTLFLTIVGAFGFVAVQNGGANLYITALCPPLLVCVARIARHSEDVLSQVRKYLYWQEIACRYTGYEHYTRTTERLTRGGHMVALRDAFLLADLLSVASALYRLHQDQAPLLISVAIALIELGAIALTWRLLAKRKASSNPTNPQMGLSTSVQVVEAEGSAKYE